MGSNDKVIPAETKHAECRMQFLPYPPFPLRLDMVK
jgi:hypothetical protein